MTTRLSSPDGLLCTVLRQSAKADQHFLGRPVSSPFVSWPCPHPVSEVLDDETSSPTGLIQVVGIAGVA